MVCCMVLFVNRRLLQGVHGTMTILHHLRTKYMLLHRSNIRTLFFHGIDYEMFSSYCPFPYFHSVHSNLSLHRICARVRGEHFSVLELMEKLKNINKFEAIGPQSLTFIIPSNSDCEINWEYSGSKCSVWHFRLSMALETWTKSICGELCFEEPMVAISTISATLSINCTHSEKISLSLKLILPNKPFVKAENAQSISLGLMLLTNPSHGLLQNGFVCSFSIYQIRLQTIRLQTNRNSPLRSNRCVSLLRASPRKNVCKSKLNLA